MSLLEFLHRVIALLPALARFAILMALIVIVPRLSRRIRLPELVGLLLSGVVLGPHLLDVFPRQHPVAQFFSELGMLLLMFITGLEINLTLFRQKIFRSVVFGVTTTLIPLLLGALAVRCLGYDLLPAIVVGSILSSHTLLGSTIVAKLGLRRLEPIVVVIGGTMVSDTLSLLVFAVCVPSFAGGFSASRLAVQIIEIIVFVPVVLFGLSRAAVYVLRKVENDEETYFVLMLGILAVTAMLAQLINLPGIVGAFLAGLAVNAAVQDKPAKSKLEFLSNTLFIPAFFVVTGFLIDPLAVARSLAEDSFLAAGIIACAPCRKMDRGRVLRPRLRLHDSRPPNDVVAHPPAGCGDARGRARCLQDVQCRRPAVTRQPNAQWCSYRGAGHVHPRAGADATLRASDAGTGAGSHRDWQYFRVTHDQCADHEGSCRTKRKESWGWRHLNHVKHCKTRLQSRLDFAFLEQSIP